MKLQTRKRIFYVFFLLFIIAGIVVVLYAEGWRLSPALQAEKAGGIYVRSFPDSAQITLNGEAVQNQSTFLSRGTFISGIFPKTYTLKLAESGYDAWTESALVLPSLVTEMKYAVLVPKTAAPVATSSTVSDFFEVSGNIVTTDESGTIALLNKTIGHGTVTSNSTDLKTAIIRSISAKSGTITYTLYDFMNASSTNFSAILQQSGIRSSPTTNVFVDPYDDTGIIAQTSAKIVDIDSGTHQAIAVETAPTGEIIESPIAVSPSAMAWARLSVASDNAGAPGTSQIIVYDKFSGDTVDSSLFIKGPVKQLVWVKNNVLGILENDNTLYLYNVPKEQLSTLANDVKQFYPATDGSAIAALEYHSLEIFSLTTSDYYRFPLPQIADVQGLIWYKDQAHLFVQYPDRVAFLDFADTGLKNLTIVSAGTAASYDPQQNALYLIDSGQKLLRFDFPE